MSHPPRPRIAARISALIMLVLVTAGCGADGGGGVPTIDPSSPGEGATSSPSAETVRLIVTAEVDTDLDTLAAALEKVFGDELQVEGVFENTGQLVITVTAEERQRVSEFSGIADIQEDRAETPHG